MTDYSAVFQRVIIVALLAGILGYTILGVGVLEEIRDRLPDRVVEINE